MKHFLSCIRRKRAGSPDQQEPRLAERDHARPRAGQNVLGRRQDGQDRDGRP